MRGDLVMARPKKYMLPDSPHNSGPIDFEKPLLLRLPYLQGKRAKYLGAQSTKDDGKPIKDGYKHLILANTKIYYVDDHGRSKTATGQMTIVSNPIVVAPKTNKKLDEEDAEEATPTATYDPRIVKMLTLLVTEVTRQRAEVKGLSESFLLFADEVRTELGKRAPLVTGATSQESSSAAKEEPSSPKKEPETFKPRVVKSFADLKELKELSARSHKELEKLDSSKVLQDNVRQLMTHPKVTNVIVGTKNYGATGGREGEIKYYTDRTPGCMHLRGQDSDGRVDLYVNFVAGHKPEIMSFVETMRL
jgi:hypothetical protein